MSDLRAALKVLRDMSDDLADAVLAGVKPDDIGQPDWEAANEAFLAAFPSSDTRPGLTTQVLCSQGSVHELRCDCAAADKLGEAIG